MKWLKYYIVRPKYIGQFYTLRAKAEGRIAAFSAPAVETLTPAWPVGWFLNRHLRGQLQSLVLALVLEVTFRGTVSIHRSVNMAQTVQKLATKVPTLVNGKFIYCVLPQCVCLLVTQLPATAPVILYCQDGNNGASIHRDSFID